MLIVHEKTEIESNVMPKANDSDRSKERLFPEVTEGHSIRLLLIKTTIK